MFISVVVLLVFIANVCAQDWPQYLGPKRIGSSSQKGILRAWPQNGPEVLWNVEAYVKFFKFAEGEEEGHNHIH